MPKIIQNVREQLLTETKRQIAENGYANTTVRSVAAACGLGVGTVYNYFPSKDMLIASFLAEEWLELLQQVRDIDPRDPRAVIYGICHALTAFTAQYAALFSDSDAARVFATVFSTRHKQLREQLAQIVYPLCSTAENAAFLSEYIAESLLTWTIAGKGFEEQYAIISRLL